MENWFFDIGKPLAKITERPKGKIQIHKIKNEREDVTVDTKKIFSPLNYKNLKTIDEFIYMLLIYMLHIRGKLRSNKQFV